MRPVHEFKANFAQAESAEVATDPLTDDATNSAEYNNSERYDTDSAVRNLCFVWEDGRKAFFNYAYLVACDLTVQDSVHVLLLSFGAYTVVVKGYHLGDLFTALLEHSPKTISAIDPRYITQHPLSNSIVTEILVSSE